MSRTVYLCGPYLNCDYQQAMGWRQEAQKLLGPHALCPTFRPEELTTANQRAMVEQDLNDLSQCPGVLANLWKPSAGSSMELWEAYRDRKLIAVVAPKPVGAWVRYVSDALFDTVSEASYWLAVQLRLTEAPILKQSQIMT